MRRALQILVGLVTLAVLFVGGMYAASEAGGEVVVLHTVAADGADQATHLWVVDDGGAAWLRSGVPTSGWFVRLQANPLVKVERAGKLGTYLAVPEGDPATRDRIHALMREKYGWADRLISASRDGRKSVPVRLEPTQERTP